MIHSFEIVFINPFTAMPAAPSLEKRPIKARNLKPLGVLIVQELCESRGSRPGLSVLTSLLVSVDVKLY